jgi:hypothetical protein
MASSYSTDLKLELMVTGENAGQWGDITNTNLNILQQAIAGYESVTLNATTGATLTFSNGLLSNGKNAVLNLAGTITSSVNVIIPDGIEKTYIVKNDTTGSFAVTFKTTSGTGATWTSADKGIKLLYSDGTNVTDVNANLSALVAGSCIFQQVNLPTQNELRFEDASGGQYVALKAGTTVASNVTFTLPTADGTADQVLQTNGSGILTFATVAGGAAWQAVVTSSLTVVAKNGYFVNTSAAAITATLPASPTLGDFISFIDYNGTFDTNNLTIARNGKNIQGVAEDLTVNVERAGLTLVFSDNTQGWLLQNK